MSFCSFDDCSGWYETHEVFGKYPTKTIIKWSREHYLNQLHRELESLLWQIHGYPDMINNSKPKWLCLCGEINTSDECKSLNPSKEHKRVKWLEDRNKMAKSEEEDLFEKFYHHEQILIANMSSDEFRTHEEELAKVAFEAKARLTAVVDKKREDNAKLRSSQKEWLLPRTGAEDALVSDAINAVGQRKKRMNKIEKLNEQLAGFVDDDTRKMLIANIERKATDSSVNLVSFVKSKTDESMVEQLKAKVEDRPVVPFDPSKLSGLFKKE